MSSFSQIVPMPKRDTIVCRAGLPAVIVPRQVAEELPIPTSEDDAGGKARSSPNRAKRAVGNAGAAVDLETPKSLLAEQSAQLMENTRMAVSNMMAGVKEDLDLHKREIKEEVHATNVKVQTMDDRLQMLTGRVEALERKGPLAAAPAIAAAVDRHKFTLVYGGWLLCQLNSALASLDPAGLTDTSAFTTGPRRSLALQTFVIRPGEKNFTSMRNRMSVIIAGISNSRVLVGEGDSRLWVSFSRTKEARQNGDHSAWMRRMVRHVMPEEEEWLELEYAAGGSWLKATKVSSAVDSPPEVPSADLLFDESKPNRPWVNTGKIAELLKVPPGKVREAANATKR